MIIKLIEQYEEIEDKLSQFPKVVQIEKEEDWKKEQKNGMYRHKLQEKKRRLKYKILSEAMKLGTEKVIIQSKGARFVIDLVKEKIYKEG